MTPSARLQAAIDILSEIDASSFPADRIIRSYFRKRRYAGSRDRRAIGDQVYRTLRRRGALEYALQCVPGEQSGPRMRALLLCAEEIGVQPVADMLVAGGNYGPAPLSDDEFRRIAAGLDVLTQSDLPGWAQHNISPWLADHLQNAVGPDWPDLVADTAERAAMDLRVNRRHTTPGALVTRLQADGIDVAPFGWTGNGLRVQGNPDLSQHRAFRDGLFEIQDAGSQLVCGLVDARPGMNVADVCAGAGGKALGLADDMQGQGCIHALDIGEKRLQQLEKRAGRAGVDTIAIRVADMAAVAPDDLVGKMDRVLVDAPCTGTGTWRRNPENRWRLQSDTIGQYQDVQRKILNNAAGLVKPGGRLVYATCSILPDENVTVITEFLTAHPEFHPISIVDVLVDGVAFQPGVVDDLVGRDGGDSLQLTTGRHRTDGFYAAVLEKHL